MDKPEIEAAHNFEGARVYCKEFTGAYCGSIFNIMSAQALFATPHS